MDGAGVSRENYGRRQRRKSESDTYDRGEERERDNEGIKSMRMSGSCRLLQLGKIPDMLLHIVRNILRICMTGICKVV